jgi:hypothetical protein
MSFGDAAWAVVKWLLVNVAVLVVIVAVMGFLQSSAAWWTASTTG